MKDEMFKPRMWDERYATGGFLFGNAPAAFLPKHAHRLPAGARTLVVGDGEGRNSVYLAKSGLAVTAMDISEVAVAKAQRLAGEGRSGEGRSGEGRSYQTPGIRR